MQKKKNKNLKAFILAAGYGSRLGEITKETPKPLVPIMGIPLILHLLKQIENTEIKDVAINTFYQKEKIKEVLKNYSGPLNITLLEESLLLGTGGGIANTKEWREGSDLLVMNSDLVHTFCLQKIIQEYRKNEEDLLFTVCTPAYPGKTLLWCFNKKLKSFREKTTQEQTPHSFACIHIAPDRILKELPEKKENYGIMGIYEELLQKKENIHTYSDPNAFWIDIGTPEDYLEGQLKFYTLMKEDKHLDHPAFLTREFSIKSFENTLYELQKKYPNLIKIDV